MSTPRERQASDESAPNRADTVFEVRDVEVTFDTSRGRSRVVRNVSLDIHRNETIGIVGESGSGKSMFSSTLLNAVVDPGQTSGEVTYYPPDGGDPIDVLDLSDKELKRFRWEEVSMVFQGAMSSFNPVMRIQDHFEDTLEDHDRQIEPGIERAHELLEELHVDPDRVMDAYPHELSGGMKQRTLIALSLILDPEVIVMDEPTAALDLLMQRSIISLLRHIQDEYDLTIVFITHDLPLLTKLADRLAVMYAFDLVELGPTEELLYHAAHPYTRALLRTTPDLNIPIDEMETISGNKPDPINRISGCSYHPRCPMADDLCRSDEPMLESIADGHGASCHHTDRVAEEIPLRFEEGEQ